MTGIMSGTARALKIELFSALRGRVIWLLLLLPVTISVLRLLLIKLSTLKQLVQSGGDQAAITGFGYLVDGMLAGLITLNIIFIAYSALNFALDRDQGVLRHLVIRSVSRQSIVAAKLLLMLVLATVAATLVIGVSMLVSAGLWELGPVVEDGYEIIGEEEIIPEIRVGLLLALLPLPVTICLGLLISVASRSAVRALVVALAVGLGFDVLKGALGAAGNYLSLSFLPAINDHSYLKDVAGIARGFSDILIDEKVYQLNIWLPLPQAIIIFILAIVLVNRKTL